MNRLILITKPYRLPENLHIVETMPSGCPAMVIPCSVITILVLTGIGAFGYDKSGYSCSDLDLHKKGDLFTVVQTIIGLPVPLVTIVVATYGSMCI